MSKYFHNSSGLHEVNEDGVGKLLTKKDIQKIKDDLDNGLQFYKQLTEDSEKDMNAVTLQAGTANKKWIGHVLGGSAMLAYAGNSYFRKAALPEDTIFNVRWLRGPKPEIKVVAQLRPAFRSDRMLRAFNTHCFCSSLLTIVLVYGTYIRRLEYNYIQLKADEVSETHQTYTLEKNKLIDMLENIDQTLTQPPYNK